MTGDLVANGYAVDIEDRGPGLPAEQLAAVNASLADPPMFDLSGSDQLGLFVAAQLARRHGIRVTLRQSGYGGVTAIALIPRDLVVLADAIGPGAVPGRTPAGLLTAATEVRRAVTAQPANGGHAAPAQPANGAPTAPGEAAGSRSAETARSVLLAFRHGWQRGLSEAGPEPDHGADLPRDGASR
jgi:hypothetical protein